MNVLERVTGPAVRILAAAVLAVLLPTVTAAPAEVLPKVADCRYREAAEEEAGGAAGSGRLFLPGDDLFRPPLADVKEPRFSAAYQSVRFRSRGLPGERSVERINAGIVRLGLTFGLVGMRRPDACDGAQLNVFGAVLSQFNLDTPSSDLINSDFLVGLPVSLRRGPFSARARLYHQSSHLGDEFLLNNPEVDRVNFSFEAFDALLSAEYGWLRLYGGGGVILRSEPELERWMAQGGAELRGFAGPWQLSRNVQALPVVGSDFKSFDEHDWDVTTSVEAGFEFANLSSRHRIRLLFSYLEGFLPFGQFFNTEEIESFGILAHFEL